MMNSLDGVRVVRAAEFMRAGFGGNPSSPIAFVRLASRVLIGTAPHRLHGGEFVATSIIPLPVSTEPGSITGQTESTTEASSEDGIAVSFDAVLQQLSAKIDVLEPETTDEIEDTATTDVPVAVFTETEALLTIHPSPEIAPEQVDEALASDSPSELTTSNETTDSLIPSAPETSNEQVVADLPVQAEPPQEIPSNLQNEQTTTKNEPEALPNGPVQLSDDRLPTSEPLVLPTLTDAPEDTLPEGLVALVEAATEARPTDTTTPLIHDRPVPVDVLQAQSQALPEESQSADPQIQPPEILSEQAIPEIDLAPTVDIEPSAQQATIESAAASIAPRAAAVSTQPSTVPERKPNTPEPRSPVPTNDAAPEWTPEFPTETEPSLPTNDGEQPTPESIQQPSTDTSVDDRVNAPVLTAFDSPASATTGLPEAPITIAEPQVASANLTASADPIDTPNADPRAADPRAGLTSVRGEVVYRSLPGGMGEQVVAAVHQTLNSVEGSSEKAIFLELQPPELGRLRIRVEQGADSITTHIVASEASSGDLLSSRRDTLQNALTDLGFGDASVDISSSQDGPFYRDRGVRAARSGRARASLPTRRRTTARSESSHWRPILV